MSLLIYQGKGKNYLRWEESIKNYVPISDDEQAQIEEFDRISWEKSAREAIREFWADFEKLDNWSY